MIHYDLPVRSRNALGLAFVAFLSVAVQLQPTEVRAAEEEVEILTKDRVGPFRPEHDPDLKKASTQIIRKTNRFREDEGLEPVTVADKLTETAQAFADYMARTDRYGHQADGNEPHERADAQGYEYCIVAENIAYHFQTTGFPTEALSMHSYKGWKNSPGHRRNMLDPNVTETGVALARSKTTGVYYAVQLFGRPRSAAIEFQIENKSDGEIAYTLGEEEFTLPSLYTRTHRMCVPAELALKANDETVATKMPAGDDHFIINKEDGKLTLGTATSE